MPINSVVIAHPMLKVLLTLTFQKLSSQWSPFTEWLPGAYFVFDPGQVTTRLQGVFEEDLEYAEFQICYAHNGHTGFQTRLTSMRQKGGRNLRRIVFELLSISNWSISASGIT